MIPEEIPEEAKHWGVKVLKGYLQFARDGVISALTSEGECESEFEEWVLQVLHTLNCRSIPLVVKTLARKGWSGPGCFPALAILLIPVGDS